MTITYDLEADAAYVRITLEPVTSTEEISDVCILDLDSSGDLVGIELLSVFGFAGASLAALVQRGQMTTADSQAILAELRGGLVAAA